MDTTSHSAISGEIIADLQSPQAYPHAVEGEVVVCETHISLVFLAGEFAYKIKKPVVSPFLDYGSLERRRHFCQEELRLDCRYAPSLYLEVVPITVRNGHLVIGGTGEPQEYAVKMKRFPDGALLSHRLATGQFTVDEIQRLVQSVADFHQNAWVAPQDSCWGTPDSVHQDAVDNLDALARIELGPDADTIGGLREWTDTFFFDHHCLFAQRVANGFIRECHGDLHLANVIDWQGKIMPFDGIEFNDQFRWIDVLSDAAFLAMDFAACGHPELCRSFLSAYLERTGDHASTPLLRWYLVFRALVRAKVDAMRMTQGNNDATSSSLDECRHHIQLAHQFTLPARPRLWITHGLSGSGKSSGSEHVVQRHSAFRLRSDLERKRHFGLDPWSRSHNIPIEKLYSESSTSATYGRLRRIAHGILHGGDSVVIDATFLRRHQRDSFRQLADCMGVPFAILDFDADIETLRSRIRDRIQRADDVSDADLGVLDYQLETHEPLAPDELQFVTELPQPLARTPRLHGRD